MRGILLLLYFCYATAPLVFLPAFGPGLHQPIFNPSVIPFVFVSGFLSFNFQYSLRILVCIQLLFLFLAFSGLLLWLSCGSGAKFPCFLSDPCLIPKYIDCPARKSHIVFCSIAVVSSASRNVSQLRPRCLYYSHNLVLLTLTISSFLS